MIKKKLFVWVCDYSESSGEGKLARLFIKEFKYTQKFKIKFNQKKIISKKYISTLCGILYCWKKYLNNQKVCYLNYLPLWNFIIFLLLPPKTILGPITGGSNYSNTKLSQIIIRGIIFPFFYKISEFLLFFRNTKLIFSTDLLKKYLLKKTLKKSQFNFVLNSFLIKKKKKKKIDFLIYYRKHKNKEIFFPYNFVQKLASKNFKIYIVGDKLRIPSVKNYGRISAKKVSKLQSIANYTIASGENLYTFFIIECLSNNIKVIVSKNIKSNIFFSKKRIMKVDFNKINLKKIKKL